jgi:hypothetical protein
MVSPASTSRAGLLGQPPYDGEGGDLTSDDGEPGLSRSKRAAPRRCSGRRVSHIRLCGIGLPGSIHAAQPVIGRGDLRVGESPHLW